MQHAINRPLALTNVPLINKSIPLDSQFEQIGYLLGSCVAKVSILMVHTYTTSFSYIAPSYAKRYALPPERYHFTDQ
jgi:hypothetical protein